MNKYSYFKFLMVVSKEAYAEGSLSKSEFETILDNIIIAQDKYSIKEAKKYLQSVLPESILVRL